MRNLDVGQIVQSKNTKNVFLITHKKETTFLDVKNSGMITVSIQYQLNASGKYFAENYLKDFIPVAVTPLEPLKEDYK